MPITKVPVVNKFGIISEKQRLEIAERLRRKSFLNSNIVRQSFLAHKNPLEVNVEFVQKYKDAGTEVYQQKYQTLAFKMLTRIQRRVGLNSFGIGKHVNLPVAWRELAQLLECTGTIQEECLHYLLLSLGQAPIHANQLVSLLFLAETLLYLLRTESLEQQFLRSTEIKLLKVCQILFTRLYFHKMANHLQECFEFKERLSCYLRGLSECQSIYSSYPDVQLSLRFMVQVGSIILPETKPNVCKLKNMPTPQAKEKRELSHETATMPCVSNFETCPESEARCLSEHSSWMSSSIHDLSPALWHALDVWRCQNVLAISTLPNKTQRENSFMASLISLIQCSRSPDHESCWVDCVVALTILAEGAKMNLTTLRVLQNIACHCINRTQQTCKSQTMSPRQTKADEGLQEDQQKNVSDVINPTAMPEEVPDDKERKKQGSDDAISKGDMLSVPERSSIKNKLPKTSPTQMSDGSSDTTPHNHNTMMDSSFYHWQWDLVLTYTTLLGDIVLCAKTSLIQKRALLGMNTDITSRSVLMDPHQCCPFFPNKKAIDDDCLGCSVGLLDLTFFQSSYDIMVDSENNWSWKVRFAAIQNLIRICDSLATDSTKEGLQTASWGILHQANIMEQDPRVLEALRVGYVQSHLNTFTRCHTSPFLGSLGSHLANGLVQIYLSDPGDKFPKVGTLIRGGATGNKVTNEGIKRNSKERSFKKHRTTLREEILCRSMWHVTPMSYNVRTTFHLRRLVEDQWRKELIPESVKEKSPAKEEGVREKVLSRLDNKNSMEKRLSSSLKFPERKAAKIFQSEEEMKKQFEERQKRRHKKKKVEKNFMI